MRNAGNYLETFFDTRDQSSSIRRGFLPLTPLMSGEVLIELFYTSLSFKDSLFWKSATFDNSVKPFVLGTDAVGEVIESKNKKFAPGDKVLCAANSLGTQGPGGLSEYLVCSEEDIFLIPNNWSYLESIAIGTPGLTAALTLIKLGFSDGIIPEHLVVSGASGAVGSFVIELASELGVDTISAITSKSELKSRLIDIGASSVLDLSTYQREIPMKLLSEKWDSGVDVLGGIVLDNITKSTRKGGRIISVGRALDDSVNLGLAPFYLRGVSMIGANLELEFPKLKNEIFQMLKLNFPKKTTQNGTKCYKLSEVTRLLGDMSSGGVGHRSVIGLKGAWI
jgi:acrylyl-CoA reductase (NADPH)